MCGRYSLRRIEQVVAAMLALPELDDFYLAPRYNVAPSQQVPIVQLQDDKRVLKTASWGFVPSWVKGKPTSRPINARAETVATSGMFRAAFSKRRCLIPADGFYEWMGLKPPKQPYFIHRRDDEPFAFAGLYERWTPEPDAESINTCTILTTTPNEVMKPIHNRMPVILSSENYDRWLDPNLGSESVADLLRPSPAEELEAFAISSKVNSPRNEGAELIEPTP